MRRGQIQFLVVATALTLLATTCLCRTTRHSAPLYNENVKNKKNAQGKASTQRHALAKISDTLSGNSQVASSGDHLGAQGICTSDSFARQLLLEALNNQYRGRYQATLEILTDNFSSGSDTLAGPIEFSDEIGQRKICLAGTNQSIEYQSNRFGKEQWVTDESTQRIRRIANRQWKKGLFGNLLTYEDLVKWPSEFFLDFYSSSAIKSSDSTYEFSMVMKPLIQTFYSKLDLTFSKKPVLLKSMTFYGMQGQKLKTMDIQAYEKAEGKWMLSNMTVTSCDSLSNLKMCFKHFSFSTPLNARESNEYREKENFSPNFGLFSKSIKDSTLSKNGVSAEEIEENPMQEVSN